jgi:hypothetical protein
VSTSDYIALAAAVIALVGLLLSWNEARRQAEAARQAAKEAKADADRAQAGVQAARQQAEAAQRQVATLQEQVEVARDHARTAAREATAAKATAAAAAGGLVFEIDRALSRFDHVHTALRPGGPGWFGPGDKHKRECWVPVELYMGTLERVQALVEAGLLGPGVILDLYGYRVANLINDDTIYTEKLVKLAYGWRRFIRLWQLLDEEHRRCRKKPLSNRRSPAQRDADEAKASHATGA